MQINTYYRRLSRLFYSLRSISEKLVFVISIIVLAVTFISFGVGIDKEKFSFIPYLIGTPAIFIFCTDRILNLISNAKQFIGKYRIGHIFNIALLSVLFIPVDSLFIKVLLCIISIMEVSSWVVRLFNRNINPGLVLSITFFLIIICGTMLLLAEPSIKPGETLNFIDALFVATSSVCVTGLTPINVPDVLTAHGLLVQMLLIQIGGLGFMTFTSFFAMFLMGNTSFYNQMVIKDITNAKSLHQLMSTLFTIMAFTFSIEIVGAWAIYLSVGSNFDFEGLSPLFFCCYHSVSAFCNAGFSTLHLGVGSNELISSCHSLYISLSFLIILGGIGYPLLANMKDSVVYHFRHWGGNIGLWKPYNKAHVIDIGTRIVAITTISLLVSGTILIGIFEWEGAFADLSITGKITQAFFNATSPRTAGFISIPLTSFAAPSILVYTILMFIGGASQSTAGGIKVDVFAVSWVNIFAMLRGKAKVVIHKREISKLTIRKTNSIIILSIGYIILAFFAMIIIQPELSKGAIVFEIVSALGTVGSSLNLTPSLCDACKMIIIFTMFVGRVGIFNFLEGFLHKNDNSYLYSYPKETLTQI